MIVITRITIFIILLLPVSLLPAQERQSRVILYGIPEQAVAGSAWTLTLLIPHNEPDKVDVLAPPFTGPLFMEQLVKGPRFMNTVAGQPSADYPAEQNTHFELWTAMEYRFMLTGSGIISFDAFTVITPQGRIQTAPFDLLVHGQPRSSQTGAAALGATVPVYRLAWEGLPSTLAIGESAILKLRVTNWNAAQSPSGIPALPEAALFVPPIPRGHIVEALPLTPDEKAAGVAVKLRLIPLEAIPFTAARRQFSPGDQATVFEIPALHIPVRPANTTDATVPVIGETVPVTPTPPFPALETAARDYPGLFSKHQAECEAVHSAARDLWEQGRVADALAALRQKERDHPAGNIFAGIRRGAEYSLGLTGTNDEKKRPLVNIFTEKSRTAVLRETALRRIPDQAGEEIVRLKEGQPVLSRGTARPAAHGKWIQITTNDANKTSGWVPEENIILY